jgi:D-alanyl-D-alanine carboxypeptidase
MGQADRMASTTTTRRSVAAILLALAMLVVWTAGTTAVLPGSAAAAEKTTKTKSKKIRAKAKAHHVAIARPTNPPPPGTKPIYESIVLDVNSGRVLHQVNADTKAYPASLTKMMTLYMVFEALEKGKLHLDTPITFSAKAAAQAPTKLGLAPGASLSTEQAIYALVTKSANDVAWALAEHLGGTAERFCARMTARAHEIGMTRSQFHNPSGLPDRGQLSTARDMAILGKRLMTEFPQYFHYFSRTEFPFHGTMLRTHNHLLENYDGADGIKTGYTAASGFNLVASARRGDVRLITVVFGGATAKLRDQHVAALMDAGFNVMATAPTVLASAQSIDPFPTGPETGATAADAAATSPAPVTVAALDDDDEDATQSAGDIDETAAPLAATATLVPPPGTGGKAKTHVAAARVEPEPAGPNTTWGIQVGAYANRTVAVNHASKARKRLQTKYADAVIRIEPVMVKKRQLYRAQVVGLERKQLANACKLIAGLALPGCRTVSPATMAAMR